MKVSPRIVALKNARIVLQMACPRYASLVGFFADLLLYNVQQTAPQVDDMPQSFITLIGNRTDCCYEHLFGNI